MTSVTATRGGRLFGLAAVCLALVAATLIWFKATGDPPAEAAVPPPTQDGWQTIEYRGVQVDVPAAWERLAKSGCEFQFAQWAPPESDHCGVKGGGASFYGSATFDPKYGPGVRFSDEKTWAGYVYAGDYAVYASDADRDLVQRVLDSVRSTGGAPPRGR